MTSTITEQNEKVFTEIIKLIENGDLEQAYIMAIGIEPSSDEQSRRQYAYIKSLRTELDGRDR